jgi:HAD superfamily hydrolase (TIGR01509 family)
MPEKHAILWDMDGVLVDTGKVHYQSWEKVLKPYDIPYSWDVFAGTFGMTNKAIITNLFDNPSADFIQEMDEEKEQLFRENVPGNVLEIPGTRQWLERFQSWGYPQAVCSSAPPANIETLLNEIGIQPYFQAIVSASKMASKPDPAVFLTAAEILGVLPNQCVVIEDAPAGIEGARQAGMKCVALTTTSSAEYLQGADLIIDDLNDLNEDQLLHLIHR